MASSSKEGQPAQRVDKALQQDILSSPVDGDVIILDDKDSEDEPLSSEDERCEALSDASTTSKTKKKKLRQ